MSAALALPQQDHRSSHSPHEIPHQRHYQPIAPSRGPSQPHIQTAMAPSPVRPGTGASNVSPRDRTRNTIPDIRPSPTSAPHSSSPTGYRSVDARPPPAPMPMPAIKTERPPSPGPPPPSATPAGARKRPQRLDLDTSSSAMAPARPSAPLTAKESGGLSAMQDVATACLSPGFDTTDPRMRQQMERSKEMADQQRAIIAQRQMKSGGKGAESSGSKPPADFGPPPGSFTKPAAGPLRKKGPPASLTLAPAGSYAGEPRVIQSAPLNQTFTGLHRAPHSLSRQVLEHSHQHAMGYDHHNPRHHAEAQYSPHVPTPSSSTRLPPITDVFASENLGSARPSLPRSSSGPGAHAYNAPPHSAGFGPVYNQPPQRSPQHDRSDPSSTGPSPTGRRPPKQNLDPFSHDLPPPSAPANQESFLRSTAYSHPAPQTAHPSSQPSRFPRQLDREHRSAEDALRSLTGGREDLLPKVVHYGGHQPPTPPSPLPPLGFGPHSAHPDSRNFQTASAPPLKVEPPERNGDGRPLRRTREEYERDAEDPDADERQRDRERARRRDIERGAAAAGLGFGMPAMDRESRARQSPDSMRRKKEEFMGLLSRAWDLLHE